MRTQCGNPSSQVRPGEQLDWQRLDRHLKSVLPDLKGSPEISQFTSGASNLTYLLRYEGDDLVVRRPPFGTKAKSAHSMSREYEIMTRLRPVFPSVPETLYYTDDESVIGSEFYVMRKIDGQIVKATLPSRWGFRPDDTRRFCTGFWDKLVELHAVDYRAAGLENFGKPEGYVERQIRGWNGRYERAMTEDVAAFENVRGWLGQNIPPDNGRHSILHGDYRIDNLILDQNDPFRILAVLDWEICALGDPLMDLGNALAYWVQADDPDFLKAFLQQPSTAPGMLTRREILDLYRERTGVDIDDFRFYLVYGYWRNAVILQQIYYRYFHGQTEDRRFASFGTAVQRLGDHCAGLIAG